MNPLFTKVALIAAGVGGASAVGGGIYYLNSAKDEQTTKQENKEKQATKVTPPKVTVSQSISKLLKEKKLRLLTNKAEDDQKWNESWGRFKVAIASNTPTAPWNFEEWSQNKDKPVALASFKKQCESFSEKTVTQEADNIFVAINTYCSTKDSDEAS